MVLYTLHMAPYLIKEPEPGNSIFKKIYCTNEIGELAIEFEYFGTRNIHIGAELN